ncbi:MAG: hypothetical protein KKA55_06685 [Proteobacteria bacterium]|nr:hypothetical protein [Pseudomonadota bacterium]MBU1595204.1 hypothetical protein [Pseudomonadota bacterium]
MSMQTFAVLLIIVGLVLGLIGHFLPAAPNDPGKVMPKDKKSVTAQDNWEGLQSKQ